MRFFRSKSLTRVPLSILKGPLPAIGLKGVGLTLTGISINFVNLSKKLKNNFTLIASLYYLLQAKMVHAELSVQDFEDPNQQSMYKLFTVSQYNNIAQDLITFCNATFTTSLTSIESFFSYTNYDQIYSLETRGAEFDERIIHALVDRSHFNASIPSFEKCINETINDFMTLDQKMFWDFVIFVYCILLPILMILATIQCCCKTCKGLNQSNHDQSRSETVQYKSNVALSFSESDCSATIERSISSDCSTTIERSMISDCSTTIERSMISDCSTTIEKSIDSDCSTTIEKSPSSDSLFFFGRHPINNRILTFKRPTENQHLMTKLQESDSDDDIKEVQPLRFTKEYGDIELGKAAMNMRK